MYHNLVIVVGGFVSCSIWSFGLGIVTNDLCELANKGSGLGNKVFGLGDGGLG